MWLSRCFRALLRCLAAWSRTFVEVCLGTFVAVATVWGLVAVDRWLSGGELLAWLSSTDLTLGQVGVIVIITTLIVRD